MTSSGTQMYPQVQQIPQGVQQQQPQNVQYQPPPPYNPNPYSSPGASLYANSLISTYGQLPPPPPPLPPQPYVYEQPTVGAKRSSDDVDLLSKRPRPDSGGSLGFYPQRPGEKLCAFYMTTRTCSFGVTCKFDHPSWVPYGGIPNWKEVTGGTHNAPPTTDPATLPQRTGEQNCAFYMKTGECKYGGRCKFNHPMDRQAQVSDATVQNREEGVPGVSNGGIAGSDAVATTAAVTFGSGSAGAISGTFLTPVKNPVIGERVAGKTTPLNSKGLPLRHTETDCTFYIKTGSCKFGASCRFNHPEVIRPGARPVVSVVPAQIAQSAPTTTVPTMAYTSADTNVHDGAVTTMAPPVKVEEYGMTANAVHPQRPGGPDCAYYLKTGECSFGATCRFHHPLNRQPTVPKASAKLTLAGLPRREGETVCAYYMKTGSCKYGSTCRFDHPPPAEVAAKAAADASRTDAPPTMLEAYDVHHPPGVPMQYVDLNPPPPPLPPLDPPPPPQPVSSIGSVITPVIQEGSTG